MVSSMASQLLRKKGRNCEIGHSDYVTAQFFGPTQKGGSFKLLKSHLAMPWFKAVQMWVNTLAKESRYA